MNPQKRWPELLIPLGVIACLLVIFVPLPASIMDILLAANITIAVIILLTSIYIKTPLELSIFPSLLLATTFARLALNIGTTRLILTNGASDKENAAGGVIQSFGEFVAGNDIAVGLVIFSIIVVVQFVVITKGATRISEVAARFALDGMPGRQMAIDADLNSGIIDSAEAKRRREEVSSHADFYGAMDGASKFVRGDAVAGVLITAFNIVGGLFIGLSHGMNLGDAAQTFTTLTIGDGLASQLPALLISLSAALLITRSNRSVDLPKESIAQVFSRPLVLVIAAGFLGLLAFTQMPVVPLMLIAAACLVVAWRLNRFQKFAAANTEPQRATATNASQAAPTEVTIDKLLSNDALEMELGIGLIRLADPSRGGHLLNAITGVRKQLANELGIILPKIRVRDNLSLSQHQYRIIVQGNPVDLGEIQPDCCLAVDTGGANGPIERNVVKGIFNDSLHAEPAYWVDTNFAENVARLGYVVLNATDVLADQLKQVSLQNAAELLTRDATQQLIDEIQKTSPAVVNELVPGMMKVGQIQQVLKNLLTEGVSIRPLALILETLGDCAGKTTRHWELTEKVRARLARHISSSLLNSANETLAVFTISEDLQTQIASSWERDNDEIRLGMSPVIIERIGAAIHDASLQLVASGRRPIALVKQAIRPVIAKLAFDKAGDLVVIGDQEVGDVEVQVVGEITRDQLNLVDSTAA